MTTPRTLTRVLVLSMILAIRAVAQFCPEPAIPTAGFPIFTNTLLVPFSDGYQVWIDIRRPAAMPGPCGWPLVMLIHGGGGSRAVVAGLAATLASRGYVTAAYDVRGQGPSSPLNPPALQHDLTGVRELIDLFEAMERVEMIFPVETNFSQIGVTGYSQGGGHSWSAAEHSGRVPPPNPWRAAPFPVVRAIVPKDAGAGVGTAPQTAFSENQANKFFGGGGINYQPALVAAAQAAIVAENFAAFDALTTAPGMDSSLLVPMISTPVYSHASYDDKRVNPSGVLATWTLVPANVPKRLQLGTGGHDSPNNTRDDLTFDQNRLQWFDRFLKGILNGVDQGPPIFAQVTPEVIATYQDPSSLWDFRVMDILPPAATVMQQFFLGPAGQLLNAPGGAGGSPIVHVVPAALNMAAYTAWFPTAVQLAAAIPVSTAVYDSAAMADDRHLQGVASVNLSVNTAAADYQLHAVLFDVDPMGNARWMTSGSQTVRATPGNNTVTIQPYVQSYVLRQGHHLRLQIENLSIHRPPTGSAPEIKFIPVLTSSVVNILEGGAVPSSIDLPFLPFPGPRLVTNLDRQSVAGLANQRMTLHTDTSSAGGVYFLGASFAGTSPGTPVGGITVPLNLDALTMALIANPALPPFINMLGVLGPSGSADAGILIGGAVLPPAFVGIELSMAAIVVTGTLSATNPVTMTFVP